MTQEIKDKIENGSRSHGLNVSKEDFIFIAKYGYDLRDNEDRWIRVEDGLPHHVDGEDDSISYLTMPHYIVAPFFNGKFQRWNNEWDDWYEIKATHYQPLPKPPSR